MFKRKICSTLKNFLMRMKEFKLDGYINKIKENEFFAGVIEIYIAFKLLNYFLLEILPIKEGKI